MFAADCVSAMTGETFESVESMRGQYNDAASASLLVPDLRPMVTSILGEPLKQVLFAQRGDVVWYPGVSMGALGIVVDSNAAIAAAVGVAYLDAHRAHVAWRV